MKESEKQSLNYRVLVLGGTGAMGTHLVNLLNQKGYHVTVTSRRMRVNFDNVTYATGNAHEPSFLNSLLALHFDVIVDFMVYNTEEFALRCKTLLKSCGQYIYLSSSRVYADSSNPITEDSPRLLDVCMDKEFLATIVKLGVNKSMLKITPTNNNYYFAPGIVLNIFKYIDLNLNENITPIKKI